MKEPKEAEVEITITGDDFIVDVAALAAMTDAERERAVESGQMPMKRLRPTETETPPKPA